MSSRRENFSGRLTPSVRRRIRERRVSLGLSLKQLGHLLDADWSTVRNWENGRTAHCHPIHVARLRGFLSGEYDMATPPYVSPAHSEIRNEMLALPLGMQFCAERLTDVCRLCADNEQLRAELLASVGRSIAGCLRSLVE